MGGTQAGSRPYLDELARATWLTAIDASSASGSRQLTNVPCLLAGWSAAQGGGFLFYLYDGAGSSDLRVAAIGGSTNAPSNLALPWPGLPVQAGLWLDVNGATFGAVVYVRLMPGGF